MKEFVENEKSLFGAIFCKKSHLLPIIFHLSSKKILISHAFERLILQKKCKILVYVRKNVYLCAICRTRARRSLREVGSPKGEVKHAMRG